MNWLSNLWNKCFSSPQPEAQESSTPQMITRNVGCVNILVSYLDSKGTVTSELVYVTGDAEWDEGYNFQPYVKVTSAETNLNHWLKGGVTFGVYDLGGTKLIPRERVLEMHLTYQDYEVELKSR